jgi:hypothetical protein
MVQITGSFRAGQDRRLLAWMIGACVLSIAGSLWSVIAPMECDSCEKASLLLGGLSIAPLGVLFYSHLMAVLIWRGSSRYVSWCVITAATIHILLLALLLSRRLLCPSCLLTAVGAFAMLGLSLVMDESNLRRAVLAVPLVLALSLAGRSLLWRVMPNREVMRQRQVRIALDREEREPPVSAGRVRLLVYFRPTCPHCRELDEKIIPVIRREFRSTVDIEYRHAWKGLVTPTVIVRGQHRTHLVGVRSADALRQAIRFAQAGAVSCVPEGAPLALSLSRR